MAYIIVSYVPWDFLFCFLSRRKLYIVGLIYVAIYVGGVLAVIGAIGGTIYGLYVVSPLIVKKILLIIAFTILLIISLLCEILLLMLIMLIFWGIICYGIIRPILFVKYILMRQHKGKRRIVSEEKADALFNAFTTALGSFLNFLFCPFRYIRYISQNISQKFSELFAALKDQLK